MTLSHSISSPLWLNSRIDGAGLDGVTDTGKDFWDCFEVGGAAVGSAGVPPAAFRSLHSVYLHLYVSVHFDS